MTRSQDGQPSTFATAIPGGKESASGTNATWQGARPTSALSPGADICLGPSKASVYEITA
jgi:hypothetical protein